MLGGAPSAASGKGEGGLGGIEGAHVGAAPFHSVTVGFMRRPRLMDGTPLHTYRAPELACRLHVCGRRSLRRRRSQHLLSSPVNKIPPREDQNQTSLKSPLPGSYLAFGFFYDYFGMRAQ